MHFALLEFIGVAIIYWRKAIGNYCSLAKHIGKYSLEEIQFLLNKAKENILNTLNKQITYIC